MKVYDFEVVNIIGIEGPDDASMDDLILQACQGMTQRAMNGELEMKFLGKAEPETPGEYLSEEESHGAE